MATAPRPITAPPTTNSQSAGPTRCRRAIERGSPASNPRASMATARRVLAADAPTTNANIIDREQPSLRHRVATGVKAARAPGEAEHPPLFAHQRYEPERRERADREPRRHPGVLDERIREVGRIGGGEDHYAGQ